MSSRSPKKPASQFSSDFFTLSKHDRFLLLKQVVNHRLHHHQKLLFLIKKTYYAIRIIKHLIGNIIDAALAALNCIGVLIGRRSIKLWWWVLPNGDHNFGDELSAIIIEKLFHKKCQNVIFSKCEMVAIGSEMHLTQGTQGRQSICVWGSGYSKPGCTVTNPHHHYYAVRGQMTKKRLGLTNVALGDPGLLISMVYQPKKPTNRIGVVAHYIDANHPLIKKLKTNRRFLIINTLDNPLRVCEHISSCKCVISSSLHGLIVADSYRVPNIHMKLSNKVNGGRYKFRDYCSGVGKKYRYFNPSDIINDQALAKVISEYQPVPQLEEVQKQLIQAFPFSVKNTIKRMITINKDRTRLN